VTHQSEIDRRCGRPSPIVADRLIVDTCTRARQAHLRHSPVRMGAAPHSPSAAARNGKGKSHSVGGSIAGSCFSLLPVMPINFWAEVPWLGPFSKLDINWLAICALANSENKSRLSSHQYESLLQIIEGGRPMGGLPLLAPGSATAVEVLIRTM
jgi:hypothetical protein